MYRPVFLILTLLTSINSLAAESAYTQLIYTSDEENEYTEILASASVSARIENDIVRSTTVFMDSSDTPVYRQTVIYQAGRLDLISVETTDLIHNKSFRGKVAGSRLEVSTQEADRFTQSTLNTDGKPLIGITIYEMVSQSMESIRAGEEKTIQILTNELDTSLPFVLLMKGEATIQGKTYDRIYMRPKSFLLSIFVPDMYFYVAREDNRVFAYSGPVAFMSNRFATYLTVNRY